MIGLEEAAASSLVEGTESCRARSAATMADAAGSHRSPRIDNEEVLNRYAVSIVGETASRYGHRETLTDSGEGPSIGPESNREALMIGELITALESKFKFGRK